MPLVLLLENIQPGADLPLWPLDAYHGHRHLVAPDTAMGGVHCCDGGPALDIAAHLRVGLTKIGSDTSGQKFQRGLHLGSQKAIQ